MHLRRFVVGCAVAVGLVAFAQGTEPLDHLGYKALHDPFAWHYDARNVIGSVDAGEQLAKNAFNTWEDAGCAYVDFEFQGRVAAGATPDDTEDALSVTTNWVTSRDDPDYQRILGGGARAAAVVPLTYAGALLRCDLFANAVDFTWNVSSNAPSATQMDLQTVLTREIGHCLGLADTDALQDPGTGVMYFELEPGESRRTLTPVDLRHVCEWYPQDGYGSRCSGTGQGTCNATSLRCLTDPSAATPFCTSGCNVQATNPCAPPFVCKSSAVFAGAGFNGACLPPGPDAVTRVGRPCTEATVATCGPSSAVCFDENEGGALPSGAKQWTGGYCSQSCSDTKPCPTGSSCVDLGGGSRSCLQNCRPGSGDCRDGYACASVTGGEGGVCLSACAGDADCPNAAGGPSYCRTCDGVCFAKEQPATPVGSHCTTDAQCGPAQSCFFFSHDSQNGVCTQPCMTACGACPNGSSCRTVPPTGQRLCLKDCTLGTCDSASGQQCGFVGDAGVRACLPGCKVSTDCPSGATCANGQCLRPEDTPPGSCALCFRGEGGSGGIGVPTDGGTPGQGPAGGCGCQQSGAAGGLGALLLFWLLFRKAPAWRRPH